jgi:hypothetical protein
MSDVTQNATEDLHIYTRLESRALNILKIERVCVSEQLNVSGYFMLSPSLFCLCAVTRIIIPYYFEYTTHIFPPLKN